MAVINTEKWLEQSYDDPREICRKIRPYVKHLSDRDLFRYLTLHGMYRRPMIKKEQLLSHLKENNIWKVMQKELHYLQKKWKGPDVNIFILPVDSEKRLIEEDLKGKSGLVFQGNLFLFFGEIHDIKEAQALFTHEYHHLCRLRHGPRKEMDYRLLDAMILEGLAEQAVKERFGKKYNAGWVSYYTPKQLEKMWNDLLFPYRNIKTSHRKYEPLMYGTGFYPRYLGYSVGYYLVQKFCRTRQHTSTSLLDEKAEKIAQVQAESE